MYLQVKKLKEDIFINPRQNSLPGPYYHPLGKDKLLIPPVKCEDYENLLLSQRF